MGKDTKIEWCHHSFNAWWGCDEVSPACANCYARELARRYGWTGDKQPELWGAEEARRFFGEKHWNEPKRWDREAAEAGERRRVFCQSMGDVFEVREDLEQHRAKLYRLISQTPNLDWLLLTKRIEHADRLWAKAAVDSYTGAEEMGPRWQPNVWIGTTVENQQWADFRVPHLLRIPAAVRFLSMEPLLGDVRLPREALDPFHDLTPMLEPTPRIGWVIVGGETGGLKTRPMHLSWARSLRDQCEQAGVPFFFKQHGEWEDIGSAEEVPDEGARTRVLNAAGGHGFHGVEPRRVRHTSRQTAGRELDGRTWDQVPNPRSAA